MPTNPFNTGNASSQKGMTVPARPASNRTHPGLQKLLTGVEGRNKISQRHGGHFTLIHLDQSFGGEAGEHFVALGGGEGLRNDSTSWTTGVPLTVLVRKYTPEKIRGVADAESRNKYIIRHYKTT